MKIKVDVLSFAYNGYNTHRIEVETRKEVDDFMRALYYRDNSLEVEIAKWSIPDYNLLPESGND